MYLELQGRWITGPVDPTQPARNPMAISWPRYETGTITVLLVDQNDNPVDLTLTGSPPPDSLTLSIAATTDEGTLLAIKATAHPTDRGRYVFTFVKDVFRNLVSGPFIYDVTAVKGSDQQEVVPTGYWSLVASPLM